MRRGKRGKRNGIDQMRRKRIGKDKRRERMRKRKIGRERDRWEGRMRGREDWEERNIDQMIAWDEEEYKRGRGGEEG